MRHAVMAMHLFDTDADKEKALCGEDTPANDLIGVKYYLKQRKDGLEVGTVCERCKALAVPFAVNLSRDREADGRVDEAHRQLADRLARETGLDPGAARRDTRSSMYGPFCVPGPQPRAPNALGRANLSLLVDER